MKKLTKMEEKRGEVVGQLAAVVDSLAADWWEVARLAVVVRAVVQLGSWFGFVSEGDRENKGRKKEKNVKVYMRE